MTPLAGAAGGCVALRAVLLTSSTNAPNEPIFEQAWISASRCAQWQERAYHWQMSHEATTPAAYGADGCVEVAPNYLTNLHYLQYLL
jgi:hypothetical protein